MITKLLFFGGGAVVWGRVIMRFLSLILGLLRGALRIFLGWSVFGVALLAMAGGLLALSDSSEIGIVPAALEPFLSYSSELVKNAAAILHDAIGPAEVTFVYSITAAGVFLTGVSLVLFFGFFKRGLS